MVDVTNPTSQLSRQTSCSRNFSRNSAITGHISSLASHTQQYVHSRVRNWLCACMQVPMIYIKLINASIGMTSLNMLVIKRRIIKQLPQSPTWPYRPAHQRHADINYAKGNSNYITVDKILKCKLANFNQTKTQCNYSLPKGKYLGVPA